jgi:membrane associated rhomboid family serine protease
MITVRIGSEEIRLESEEFDLWAQDGRIPPGAQVFMEGTGWVPVEKLEIWRRAQSRGLPPPAPREPNVSRVLFPARSVSATELLLLVNLLVAAILVAWLRSSYLVTVVRWAGGWWHQVRDHHAYWWWIPTLFLHAGPKHLLSNMTALLATSGAVEYLMGKRWAYLGYFITGLAGMWLSYVGHARPPLSIGASGAVFGLGGMAASFLIRRYRTFSYRQRWKARRVYGPLFVALVLPSILNADYLGHLGGFLSGFILGFLVPAHPRVHALAEGADEPEPPEGAGGFRGGTGPAS